MDVIVNKRIKIRGKYRILIRDPTTKRIISNVPWSRTKTKQFYKEQYARVIITRLAYMQEVSDARSKPRRPTRGRYQVKLTAVFEGEEFSANSPMVSYDTPISIPTEQARERVYGRIGGYIRETGRTDEVASGLAEKENIRFIRREVIYYQALPKSRFRT